jgi:hypothetical protein
MAVQNEKSVLIGCDPEVFLRKRNTDEFISAHFMADVVGDKMVPLRVDKGYLQLDGTALEFNIDPAYDRAMFFHNITSVFTELLNRVYHKDKDAYISYDAVAHYKPKIFKDIPEEFKVMGCEPDFNAWTEQQQNIPITNLPMRSAGGHIHLGWSKNHDCFGDVAHLKDCVKVVKQLDCSVYNCSLLYDDDEERRMLYGQRGSYRPKPYGVEYRALSNRWLADPQLIHWVFDAHKYAFDTLVIDDINFADDDYLASPSMTDDDKDEKYVYLVKNYDFPRLPSKYEPDVMGA